MIHKWGNRLQAALVFVLWHMWMSGCCWSLLFEFNVMSGGSRLEIAIFSTSLITVITLIAYREAAKFYEGRCIL